MRLDFDAHCVCVRSGALKPADKAQFKHKHLAQLCIEDPFDAADNVARSLTEASAKRVRLEFLRAYEVCVRVCILYVVYITYVCVCVCVYVCVCVCVCEACVCMHVYIYLYIGAQAHGGFRAAVLSPKCWRPGSAGGHSAEQAGRA